MLPLGLWVFVEASPKRSAVTLMRRNSMETTLDLELDEEIDPQADPFNGGYAQIGCD